MSKTKKTQDEGFQGIVSDSELDKFDGFYFIPEEEDYEENYKLVFFNFEGEKSGGTPIESSEMGLKYHMCFFKHDENNAPVFDDAFEAILVNPLDYIKNLVGSGLAGCIVKKTENSEAWWVDYLDYIMNGEFKKKVKESFGSLAE